MKVALAHDYLKEYGGAERVLEVLHEIFPDAPVFTAYYNPKSLGIHAKKFEGWDIKTSFLQKLPFAGKLISPLRIIAPKIFENFDLNEYDLVISSCNTYFSKAVKVKPEAKHISYIHTPPRYLYGYTTSFNYKKHWWTRILAEIMNHYLRIVDFEVSQNPDILIANSENVRKRILKFYRRNSVVIYPPISLEREKREERREKEEKYFLSLSRLVRGKGVEIIVEACSRLGVPLKIVGTGPELSNLKKIAGKNIEFLGQVEDGMLPGLYENAKALIVASEDEDFGITSIEAQSVGAPVIAIRKGGYLETIVEGETGEFFNEPNSESLTLVLENFDEKKYVKDNLKKNAEKFSKEKFKKEILKLIKNE